MNFTWMPLAVFLFGRSSSLHGSLAIWQTLVNTFGSKCGKYFCRNFLKLWAFGTYIILFEWNCDYRTQAYKTSHGLILRSDFTALTERYFAIPSHHIDPSPDSYLTESFSAFTTNSTHESIDVLFYLGVYGAIGLTSIAIFLITFVLLIFASARASRNLHRRLLDRVCAAPIRWFDK